MGFGGRLRGVWVVLFLRVLVLGILVMVFEVSFVVCEEGYCKGIFDYSDNI